MKKSLVVMSMMCMMLLTACSETTNGTGEQESTRTATEVYDLAMKQVDNVDSTAFTMYIEQTLAPDTEEQVTTKAELVGKMIEEPFQMHTEGTISMDSPPFGNIDLEIEAYAENDAVYVYENLFNNWNKGSIHTLNDFGIELEGDPLFSHMENIEPYMEEFTFEQTNHTFTFTLASASDSFQQVIIEELQVFPAYKRGSNETNPTDIEHLHYSFTIDKKTYNILSFSIACTTAINEGDGSSYVLAIVEAAFSNVNQVEGFTIPQDVIDQASDGGGFGF